MESNSEISEQRVHGVAIAVAVDADGPLVGVLILGRSGAGKSALALSLVENCPWRRTRLASDDVVTLHRAVDGRVWAAAPEEIRGLIEVRGFGPAPVKSVHSAPITAVFDLDGVQERVPEKGGYKVLGAVLPLWPLALPNGPVFGAVGLRVALRAILAGQTP